MGFSQSKPETVTLPDGTIQLTFIDYQAKQKQYEKYVVTYTHETSICIEQMSQHKDPWITCSHLI